MGEEERGGQGDDKGGETEAGSACVCVHTQ